MLAESTITDIVGTTGVFLDDAGQGDLSSYCVISQQGHDPLPDITQTTSIGNTQIDIDCYAKSRVTARSLADKVTAFIKDFSGTASSNTFHAVNWIDEGTDVVKSADGSRVHYYVFTETIQLHWS